MNKLSILTLMLLSLLTACTNAQLTQNKQQQTSSQAAQNYQMRISQRCYCPQRLLGPFDLVVKDGQPYSLIDVNTQQGMPLYLVGDEIPDLASVLARIAQAKADQVETLDIEWWQEPDVPAKVFIDFSKRMADDEWYVQIENFKLLSE